MRFLGDRRLEICWEIRKLKQGRKPIQKKLANKASYYSRPPLRSRLEGVAEEGLRESRWGDNLPKRLRARKVPLGSPLLRSGHVHDQNSLKYKAIISLKVKEKLFLRYVIFLQITLLFVASLVKNYIRFYIYFYFATMLLEK